MAQLHSSSAANLSPAKRQLLAQLMRGGSTPAQEPPRPGIPTAAGTDFPLSSAQRSVWLLDQLSGDIPMFNILTAFWPPAEITAEGVKAALAPFIAAHDSLRMRVDNTGAEPRLVVEPTVEPEVAEVCCPDPGDDVTAAAIEAARRFAAEPYAMDTAPLWRVGIIDFGRERRLVVFSAHHLALDATSLSNFALQLGGRAPMAFPPIRYVDYAMWQQSRARDGGDDAALGYWRQRLADLPEPLDLPADRPRPVTRDLAGNTIHRDLTPDVEARVAALSRAERATPYMTLLTVFAALLYRYTGQRDLLIGSSVSGRTRPELTDLLGMLVNLVPIRLPVDGDVSFRDLLATVRVRVAEALAQQDLPYDELIRDLRPRLPRNRPPLVQVAFNMPYSGVTVSEALMLPITPQGSQLDLTVHIVPMAGLVLRVEMEYATSLFDASTIERMLSHYETLVDAFTADPDLPLRAVPLADEPTTTTGSAGPLGGVRTGGGECLPDLIAAQALRTPDAVAVFDGHETVTYAQLLRRADTLAQWLRRHGVSAETLVGVYLGRGVEAVTALLAVWRAGGCYLPLDPEHPAARTAAVVADAGVRVAVTAQRHADQLAALGLTVLCTDIEPVGGVSDSEPVGGQFQQAAVPAAVTADNAAYILYTSGSTGRPKGVVITHGGIANRVLMPIRSFGLGPADRVLHKTALTFDAAGWEIFSPLVCGGTVVIAPPGVERDPAAVLAATAATGITVLQVVPSLLRQLVAAPQWPGTGALRLLTCAGEPLSGELCTAVHRLTDARIVNTYGPTECAIDITAHEWCPRQSTGPVPIGLPIDGMRTLVLDRDGVPVPVGVTGELYAGGVGVARGYLGRSDLTADWFVPNPVGPPGSRLYRTGDLVRRRPDGTLVFVGRSDDQMKVNGVRVELAEVEQAMACHPAVRAAAVLAPERADGGRRLVGYVVVDGATTAELRAHLFHLLPGPMVPGVIVTLTRMPTTSSGKIDRVALAGLGIPVPDQEHVPLADVYEEMVAGAWAELLPDVRIGATDDFFALGGHSLQLAGLATLLRQRAGRPVNLVDLYSTTTVRAQARLLRAGTGAAGEAVTPVSRDERLVLSAGQRRMWFLERLDPGQLSHTVPVVLPVPDEARTEDVAAAVARVVSRHEILRTRYLVADAEPYQVVDDHVGVPVSTGRVSGGVVDALSEALPRLAAEPFDLAAGPVLRCRLVRTGTAGALLVVLLHHIAWDGGSLPVFAAELDRALAAVRDGRRDPPPPPFQYADYAAWQQRRRASGGDDVAYWRERLSGAAGTSLTPDLPRPPVWTGRGHTFAFAVDAAAAESARRAGRAGAATPFMTMLTAFQRALCRLTGGTDMVLGTPVAARTSAQVEGLIGYFANTIVLRTDLSGNPGPAEALARTREATLAAYRHQETPFDDVVDALRPPRDPSRTPLFSIMFDMADRLPYLPVPAEAVDPAELRLDWPASAYELTLSLVDRPDGGYLGVVEYARDLFHRPTVRAVVDAFLAEVAALGALAAPDGTDGTDGSARRAGPAEPAELAEAAEPAEAARPTPPAGAGGARVAGPGEMDLSAVLRGHAAGRGQAEAVRQGHATLTYTELDDRVSALASAVRATGLPAGAPVAVCLPRGVDLVVAALAVMRAGFCHMPLDVDAPSRRIADLVRAAGAPLLIADGTTAPVLAEQPELAGVTVLATDGVDEVDAPAARHGSVEAYDRAAPAYLVHTSGSTGAPKGVVVNHGAYAEHCRDMVEAYGVTASDRMLMTCPSFVDVAMENIGVAVTAGACLVLAEPGPWSPRDLPDLIRVQRVSVIDIPPVALRDMLDVLIVRDPRLSSLRLLNVGTDAVYAADVQRLSTLDLPARCVASYGPTEAVITASLYPLAPADLAGLAPDSVLAIGRATTGRAAHVVTGELCATPDGQVGELVLGGTGLADGYHRQPALTAERFVPDPFADRPGARMYRTGDLVARRPDGILDFHGRADRQVKINSFRVELGEVEARLRGHDQVRDAAVVALRRDDLTQLAAYVVPAGPVVPPAAQLRRYLRERLPAHMVPLHWTVLASLPTTSAGKLDPRALPEPDATPADPAIADEAAPPENGGPLDVVRQIWRAVLGLSDIEPDDDFFDLGGNSMAAIRVHARLQDTFEITVSLRAMFEATTPAALARLVLDEVSRAVAELSDEDLLALARAERETNR